MNEHERTRIAEAMNRLRPDWPVKQLMTLLDHQFLADRPRRDVTVALAWVACESATASPFRVIEAGPWWQAAAVEGSTTPRNVPIRERCNDCGKAEQHPIHANDHPIHANDHPFERVRHTEGDVAAEVAHLRDLLHRTTAPDPKPHADASSADMTGETA